MFHATGHRYEIQVCICRQPENTVILVCIRLHCWSSFSQVYSIFLEQKPNLIAKCPPTCVCSQIAKLNVHQMYHVYCLCFHNKCALIKVAPKVNSDSITIPTNFVMPKIHFVPHIVKHISATNQ